MANAIETQDLRTRTMHVLCDLEMTVTAMRALGNISANLQPQDMEDFAFVCGTLSQKCFDEYSKFHAFYAAQIYPVLEGK